MSVNEETQDHSWTKENQNLL